MADHLSLAEKSSTISKVVVGVAPTLVPYPGTPTPKHWQANQMTSLSPPRKYVPYLTQHSVCVIVTYRNLMVWVLCMRQRHPKRPPSSSKPGKSINPSSHPCRSPAGSAMTITFGDVAENGPGNFAFHDWVRGWGWVEPGRGCANLAVWPQGLPNSETILAMSSPVIRHSKPLCARPQAWSTCSGLAVAHCPRAKA
jgi:hypothetical protein